MSQRRLFFGLTDQGIVSLTSIVILASVAQYSDAHELGEFSIGLSSVLAAVSIARTLTGETLLVRITSKPERYGLDDAIRHEASKALGLAWVIATGAAALMIVIGVLWTDVASVLFASAVAVFFVIGHDTTRHVCISLRRGTTLLFGDVLVMVLSVVGVLLAGHLGGGPHHMLLAWGTANFIGFVTLLVLEKVNFSIKGGIIWLKITLPASSAFAFEAILGAATGYAIVVALGITSSPTEVAAYRTAMSVFGLTSVVINALRTVVMRELTPGRLSTQKGLWHIFVILTLVVSAVCAATLLVVVTLPPVLGNQAFGETWYLVVFLAPFASLNRLGAGLSVVPLVFLRVQGVTWAATRIKIVVTIFLCFVAPLCASVGGAAGAFTAEAVAYLLVAVLFLRKALLTSRASGDQ